ENRVIEGILLGRLDAQALEVVMNHAFPDHHETASHGDAVRAQGQSRSKAPAVVESSGCDQRNLYHARHYGDEDHGGSCSAMARCLVPGDDQGVAPNLHGLCSVLCDGDGADDLAPVGVNRIDKPWLAQGVVDDGDFLVDGRLEILPGSRPDEDLV